MKKYVIIFALLTVHIAGIAQEPFNGRISMIDGKGIKAYTNLTRHYKDSSEVRQKLGLSESDTNLSIFLKDMLEK